MILSSARSGDLLENVFKLFELWRIKVFSFIFVIESLYIIRYN